MVIKIDYKKCCWKDGKCSSSDCGCRCEEEKICGGCIEVCPVDAISRKSKVIINAKKCIECGACVSICKHHALSLS